MTIDSLIVRLPKSIVADIAEIDIKTWILDSLKHIPSATTYDKIQIINIEDGKYKLPKDFVQLNNLFWQQKPLSEDMCNEFKCEPFELREQVCKPMIYFTIFLNSEFYKQCFTPLKYVGKDKSLLCKDCLTSNCSETFIITPEKMLHTSFTEGTLCLHYKSNTFNDELFIDDLPVITDYVVSYVSTKYWEERMFNKEENTIQIYNQFKQQTDLLLRKVRGSVNLRSLNMEQIINGGRTNINNNLQSNEELRKPRINYTQWFR